MARGRRGARGAPAARPVSWARGHAPAPVQIPRQLTVEPTAKGPPPSPPAATSDLVPVSEPTLSLSLAVFFFFFFFVTVSSGLRSSSSLC